MAADAGTAAAASIALGQTIGAYSFFLPPLREVRRAGTTDTAMRGDVRLGQVASAALSLGVAAILANLTGSTLPVAVTVIVALIIAFLYETALRGERLFEA
jgi:hypothetical protein